MNRQLLVAAIVLVVVLLGVMLIQTDTAVVNQPDGSGQVGLDVVQPLMDSQEAYVTMKVVGGNTNE